MVIHKHLKLQTRGHRDFHDLTDGVNTLIRQSGLRTGLAHIFVAGSTAAVGTIEFEPGLQQDLGDLLDRLIPPRPDYAHEQAWHDGNAHSHLQATLLRPAITIPVDGCCLVLGAWQQLFFLECDIRPRERTIIVTLMGE
ncbi:MAG: YjbQ family protein [Isosphaeraceae bacterium]|nr:YjbQ family protein [Isosphaeraceae bacterium]